ncbi:MAG TPA: MmcQ/YjbR family DNA-binding protein [Candidatus Limnocylindria bacterium]|jgi:hypothetical protein|nr:MmcQ/YjbR family DNA-binding protein [Candidatus Limnocylindria bacterium]
MTADTFRRLALALPGAAESAHMNHPDFRVGGKIFATLGYPDGSWGMIKLAPAQQAEFLLRAPKMFQPVRGAWGRQGSTNVHLPSARVAVVREAMAAAWRNLAPQRNVT